MVDLTRRWFVFGATAAVATAVVQPATAFLQPPIIEPAASAHVFLSRKIRDITMGFDSGSGPDQMAVIELFAGKRTVFHQVMSTRSTYHWLAEPGGEIDLMPSETFTIVANSNTAVAQITLICEDKIDDGSPVIVCEQHTFPQSGPVQPMFMHVDNSREARDARAEQARLVASKADDEFVDFDDEYWNSNEAGPPPLPWS